MKSMPVIEGKVAAGNNIGGSDRSLVFRAYKSYALINLRYTFPSMFKEQANNLLLGILLSTMIYSSFLAISEQISEKVLAQSKTGSNNMTIDGENVSAMMVNKL
jgi:zona occludens toxin (predicted ATPase)